MGQRGAETPGLSCTLGSGSTAASGVMGAEGLFPAVCDGHRTWIYTGLGGI